MGKIIDMQEHQNNLNFNYVKKNNPKLDTKGIKNFYNKLHLIVPGTENKYSLTREQKKLARKLRLATVTSVGIIALASSINISTAVYNHLTRENLEVEALSNAELLDRATVIENAENVLIEIIDPTIHIDNKQFDVVYPSRDEYRNINSVQVNDKFSSAYRYINTQNKINKENSAIFNDFMDMIIKIANTSEPSQKDLLKLDALTKTIDSMNLQFNGKNIIDLDEKDKDFERD